MPTPWVPQEDPGFIITWLTVSLVGGLVLVWVVQHFVHRFLGRLIAAIVLGAAMGVVFWLISRWVIVSVIGGFFIAYSMLDWWDSGMEKRWQRFVARHPSSGLNEIGGFVGIIVAVIRIFIGFLMAFAMVFSVFGIFCGGGGFRGGGGSFGGGGASGRW